VVVDLRAITQVAQLAVQVAAALVKALVVVKPMSMLELTQVAVAEAEADSLVLDNLVKVAQVL
jgi:hypothetical protein